MSKTVFRYDRGSLRSPKTTPQGFLRVDGYPARTGIYEYRRADGSVQLELRPHEEVMHPDSLASYDAAPITIEHPIDGEVNAENVRRHEVGTVAGAARADGDVVAAELVVKDAKAIKLVRAGKQELSPGSKIELDETPGHDQRYATAKNPTGRYDAVQRKIRVNHLAIVDRARGGSEMRLRMDSAEDVTRDDAVLTAAQRRELPDSDFAVPDREGLPIGDEGHLTAAMARFGQYEFTDNAEKKAAYGRILRRAKALGVDASGFAAKWRLDAGGELTSVTNGHQHLIDTCGWDGVQRTSGETSCAMSEGTDQGHEHPWVRMADGSITVGMADGHTHSVLEMEGIAPGAGYSPLPRADAQIDRIGAGRESHRMDPNEQIRSLKEQLAAAEAKLTPLHTAAANNATRADTAEAGLVTLRSENENLRAQIAAAAVTVETAAVVREKVRADAAEAELRSRDDAMSAAVEARVALERKAAVVMPDLNMRGIPDRQIVATIVKRLDASQDTGPSVTDAYLTGRMDSLLELHARNARSLTAVSEIVRHQHEERADSLEEQRRKHRDQWREPLPNSREAQAARGRA